LESLLFWALKRHSNLQKRQNTYMHTQSTFDHSSPYICNRTQNHWISGICPKSLLGNNYKTQPFLQTGFISGMVSSGLLRRLALLRTDVSPGSSETSVLTRATRRNNPEDTILHSHRRENLKSYIGFISVFT
jgi:hypothetical protein